MIKDKEIESAYLRFAQETPKMTIDHRLKTQHFFTTGVRWAESQLVHKPDDPEGITAEELEHQLYGARFGSQIPKDLYDKFVALGLTGGETRDHNVGASDYSKHVIQPWSIWQDYNLNAWDADIVKRVLRTKEGESRITDYEKIIHICQERIRQLSHDKG